jgi:hypothetical protein
MASEESMSTSSIEASFSGLKLSYVRFISDSAPGFVVLLLVVFGGQQRSPPWWAYHKEFKVLVATVAFLLATPVGLSLNAISYFVLGHIQSQINRICFLSRGWPMRDTRRMFLVEESRAHFGFSAENWAERNDVYGELLETYRPDLALRIEPLRGLKRFLRSISFIAFLCFFYSKPGGGMNAAYIALGVFLWFVWIFTASLPGRFGKMPHEIGIAIVLAVVVLIVAARLTGVTWQTIDPIVNEPFRRICILAVALFGLLVTGMVDFYERATIAMYLHIECLPSVKDSLSEISEALRTSAKLLRV